MPPRNIKTIYVGRINISVHPHHPGIYHDLLMNASAIRSAISLTKRERAILGSVTQYTDSKLFCVPILRYYNLNPFGLWLNTNSLIPYESTEEHPLTNIPIDLKPEFRIVNAFLVEDRHEIVFDATMITPRHACKFFSDLFNTPAIFDKYGQVDVNIIQHPGAIDKVLSVPNLHSVHLLINRPNPDDDEEDEKIIEDRMKEMRAYRWEQNLSARPRTREPMAVLDSKLKAFAKVALRNGEVWSHGYDEDGKPITVFSRDTPYEEPVRIKSSFDITDFINAVKEQLVFMSRGTHELEPI